MHATTGRAGRPGTGVGHYLRDIVFGALDGVITTLAVVAGVSGARLPGFIALVLGVANLLGDGVSMAAGNYLGMKSELEQTGASVAAEKPWRHGVATLAAFVLFGAIPLVAFAFTPPRFSVAPFEAALGAALLTLTGLGVMRAPFVRKPVWRSAVEIVLVGGAAGALAYGVGLAAHRLAVG